MKDNEIIKWKTALNRGNLEETMETEKEIEPDIAITLISSGIYIYYAYDERIEAHRFLIRNIEKNLGLPQWLHEYIT